MSNGNLRQKFTANNNPCEPNQQKLLPNLESIYFFTFKYTPNVTGFRKRGVWTIFNPLGNQNHGIKHVLDNDKTWLSSNWH